MSKITDFSSTADSDVHHLEHPDTLAGVRTAELPTALADHVAYGPNGVRGIISSPYVFGAALLASLGGFSFGYDQGVISIINVMPQFHARYPQTAPGYPRNGFYTGFMTGMLEFGAFLGCFFMPKLADKISRKWALTVVVVIFNIRAIIQTSSMNYGTLVAGRTIGGIGVGTLAMGAPLYISEIAPPNLRGCLLVPESVSVVTGVVIAYWITFATRHMSGEIAFRLPFGLQMVCATILGVAIHLFPYSPRWLALVGRNDDALDSLFQQEMLEKRHPGKSGISLEIQTWLDLFRSKTRKRTFVGCGVAFFQQFSGINGFIYYAPILFVSLGLNDEMALMVSGALNIWQLIAIILCFFIVNNVGRRPLAIFGGFSSMVPYIVMAVLVGKFSHNWPAYPAQGWACIAMAFVYILCYGSTYAPLGWAIPPEVFTTATRAKGVAFSTATLWFCNFVIGVIVPPMIQGAGFGTYVFFGCMCGLAGIWAYFFVPETKQKTLEEISVAFGDGSGMEEKEAMKAAVVNARRSSAVTERRLSGVGVVQEKV